MSPHRRAFLKSLVGFPSLVSLSPVIPPLLARTVLADSACPAASDNVLVLLQLSGGNDGLNTIVPVGDDQYARHRRTLRFQPGEVLRIDDYAGFHPELRELARLFAEARLSVVQSVGYPDSSRDHEVALRDWHTAQPGHEHADTGWLGRALDSATPASPMSGIIVGSIRQPQVMTAARTVAPRLHSLQQLAVNDLEPAVYQSPHSPTSGNPLLDHVRRHSRIARLNRHRMGDVLAGSDRRARYPDSPLAAQFHIIADLLRAELGTRVFFAELGGDGFGGFDNHANQRDNHAALLRQLSQAVAAFLDDLASTAWTDRVLLVTFSEFGRTLSENGRRGTDHGAAAPLFLAGNGLRGGLIGPPPDLNDLQADAPVPHTDFRSVYATLLEQWLALPSQPILGRSFPSLDLLPRRDA